LNRSPGHFCRPRSSSHLVANHRRGWKSASQPPPRPRSLFRVSGWNRRFPSLWPFKPSPIILLQPIRFCACLSVPHPPAIAGPISPTPVALPTSAAQHRRGKVRHHRPHTKTPAPPAHVPLFPAPEANPETGLLPPVSFYTWSGHHIENSIYSVLSGSGPGRKPPGGDPCPKNFKPIFPSDKPERGGPWPAQGVPKAPPPGCRSRCAGIWLLPKLFPSRDIRC
jgi:hypothetical protein